MFKPEDFAAAGKAQIDSVLSLANVAFSGTERLAALNLSTARSLHEDNVAAMRALLNVKSPEELSALQASLGQPTAEKALAYSRSAYQICVEAGEQLAKLSSERYDEISKEVSSAVDEAAKAAPAGTEPAVAAIKSALAAASSAYEAVTKAAKQIGEIADASVASLGGAAGKSPAPKAKKAS